MPDSHLYYGDNLDILKRYIKDESVDLVGLPGPAVQQQCHLQRAVRGEGRFTRSGAN